MSSFLDSGAESTDGEWVSINGLPVEATNRYSGPLALSRPAGGRRHGRVLILRLRPGWGKGQRAERAAMGGI